MKDNKIEEIIKEGEDNLFLDKRTTTWLRLVLKLYRDEVRKQAWIDGAKIQYDALVDNIKDESGTSRLYSYDKVEEIKQEVREETLNKLKKIHEDNMKIGEDYQYAYGDIIDAIYEK